MKKRLSLLVGIIALLNVGLLRSQTVLSVVDTSGYSHDINIITASCISFIYDSITILPRTGNNTEISFSLPNVRKMRIAETVSAPKFSPEEGVYTEPQTITIGCTTEDATIYYTTDGSDPLSINGTIQAISYSSPITIRETTFLKAVALKEGMHHSDVVAAKYVIETNVTGVSEIESPVAVLYPNPVDHCLIIEGVNEGDYVIIYSMNGDKVLHTRCGVDKQVDVSSLKSGNYFVVFENKAAKFVKK